jgi:DNA-binding PadR family transcriptional regulator
MRALLIEGPQYGLQLGQEFEDRTGEVWPLNVSQVHTTTLRRLGRDGLVGSDERAAPSASLTRGRRRVPDA